MKRLFPLVCALLLVFMATAALAGDDIPDLTGKWSGAAELHRPDMGFQAHAKANVVFEIKEQQGHTFHGVKSYTRIDGATAQETFSGVVSADGKQVYIAEHEDGLILGDVLSENEMAFYYLEHGEAPKAIYYGLTRSE